MQAAAAMRADLLRFAAPELGATFGAVALHAQGGQLAACSHCPQVDLQRFAPGFIALLQQAACSAADSFSWIIALGT